MFMSQCPNGQFREEGSLNSEQRERGQKAAVFILPQSIYSLLPESYLPLTFNSLTLDSATNLPCLWPLLPLINIKHVYTWAEAGIFRLHSVACCREHWHGLLNIHHTRADKPRTVGPDFCPTWFYMWPNSHRWDETCGRNFLSKHKGHRKNCYGCFATVLRRKGHTKMAEWRRKERETLASCWHSEPCSTPWLPFRWRL